MVVEVEVELEVGTLVVVLLLELLEVVDEVNPPLGEVQVLVVIEVVTDVRAEVVLPVVVG